MNGPPLAIAVSALTLLASAGWIVAGGTEVANVSAWVRATAWGSALFFLMTFVARPLHQLRRSAQSGWLLRNRRYLGVSAAFIHFVHFIGVVWVLRAFADEGYAADALTLIFGGFGFVVYFAMGLTSNDASVARLGRENWKRLHTYGSYYVWFIYSFTLFGSAVSGRAAAALLLAAFVSALGLRIATARSRRKATA